MYKSATFMMMKLLVTATIAVGGVAQAGDKDQEQQLMQQDQRLWLMEKLKTAKPAPVPKAIPYTEAETRSPEQNTIVEKDLRTGQESESGPRLPVAEPSSTLPSAGAGKPELKPVPPSLRGSVQQPGKKKAASLKNGNAGTGAQQSTVEQVGGEIIAEALPPGLLLETTTFPWNTTHKLLMEFYSSTDAQYYYYVCSGWSTGSFHIATAGHCVYNHDPNGDGNTADASWATQVWTWAAQTDRVDPYDVGDFPYGVAMGTFLRSYTGWTDSVNFDHDWAVVTLDRRQGDHTGWMGREAGVSTTTLNFTGYPVESPYVPSNSLGQYAGLADVLAYTSGRIQLDAFIYGGHSGGPSWRFDGTDRFVQGIHSTSNRAGYAEDTLITSGKMGDLTTWMSDDETNSPPVAQPNLIEYWFDIAAKDVLTNSVSPGGSLTVEYNALNAGFVPASSVNIDFYLSTNDFISVSDIYIGTVSYGSIAEWSAVNAQTTLTVPLATAPGSYYVGWLLSTATPEYNTDDNQVVITSEQVTVSGQTCVPDLYEPDNSSATANGIAHNTNQTHNICPVADEDWVTFTLTSASQVTLETSGLSGDTRMWLYDAALNEVEYNDDGGANLFSFIDRVCGTDQLAAGTYYVKIDEYGSNNEIESYDLSLGVTECAALVPDIRVEPLSMVFDETVTAAVTTKVTTADQAGPAGPGRLPRLLDRTIRFKRGVVDPATKQNRLEMQDPSSGGRRHMLMQFGSLPGPREKTKLAASGIRLLSYIPNQAYWVSLDNQKAVHPASVTASGGVVWAWVPDPVYKMSERIDAGDFPPNAKHSDSTVSVQVLLFEDVDSREATATIDGLGGGVRVLRPLSARLLEVRTPMARIRDIADLDVVRWVEPASPPKVEENATAASRIHADVLLGAPFNVDGSPLTVGIWDGGSVDAHTDFDTRLTVVDLASVSDHSTHVAGTIGGSGLGSAAARGMAPATNLRSYDWNSDTTEMRTAATSNNVIISNHSYGLITGWYWNGSSWVDYGSSGFGLYDSNAAEYDDIVFDTNLLVFKSAGNDRNDGPDCPAGPQCDGPYDSVGYIGNAKNILTICALSDTDVMTDFSSWGPTNDGRIKPDLCANGTSLYSTLPGNSYGSYSGTSMASPSAAGATTLLYQHFQNELGSAPSAALMKALMVHAAADLGAAGPDYQHGWGIIDALTTANLITARAFSEGVIPGTGDMQEYTFDVTGGDIKVSLAWTDPAGDPLATSALVNDLELVLIAPDGTTHYPWVLDPANPAVAATTGVNSRDNVEQVVVSSAAAGTWTARVSGFAVPAGPQTFALVGEGLSANNTQILTIFNDGNAQLAVTDITPETAAPWISVNPTTLDVPPGTSRSVVVQVDFALAPGGTNTTRLLVYSDDPDESPYPGGVDVTTVTACVDTDTDGICDSSDNCIQVSNPSQCDGDGDGYGNHCDADFNNDLIVNGLDAGPFKNGFGTSDPVTDLNCDGITNGLDVGPFKAMFGLPPGPSGLVP